MKKVCLLAFVLFTWSIVVNAQESDGRYVEVTGSSEIEVVPDEIHFLVQIKEYWQEEYTGKSKKEEDFHTKVPLAMIEKDLRKSLRKIGITDDAIRTQEIGDYWRQRGKEFLIGKQLDIRLTDFEQNHKSYNGKEHRSCCGNVCLSQSKCLPKDCHGSYRQYVSQAGRQSF